MFCIAPPDREELDDVILPCWCWFPIWPWVEFGPRQLSHRGRCFSANRGGSSHGHPCQDSPLTALICSSGSQLCSLLLAACQEEAKPISMPSQPPPGAALSLGNPQPGNCRCFPALGAWPRWEPAVTPCLSSQLPFGSRV